ncbi:MAG: rhodanese-like domain-containing protein [Desulfuromusa sp.]|nr:rhodanese-like domain-containing protein [Desulfuromusa sp.]
MLITIPARLSLILVLCLTFISSAVATEIPKRPADVQRITMTEFQDLQTSGVPIVIIDTRTPGQWQQASDKIPGAVRVTSRKELQQLQKDVPPDTEIVTYCT